MQDMADVPELGLQGLLVFSRRLPVQQRASQRLVTAADRFQRLVVPRILAGGPVERLDQQVSGSSHGGNHDRQRRPLAADIVCDLFETGGVGEARTTEFENHPVGHVACSGSGEKSKGSERTALAVIFLASQHPCARPRRWTRSPLAGVPGSQPFDMLNERIRGRLEQLEFLD